MLTTYSLMYILKKQNNIVTFNHLALIPLLNTIGRFSIIDIEDIPLLSKFEYGFRLHHGYAVTKFNRIEYRLHTIVSGIIKPDHINCNKLDNRKCNLRIGTNAQNMWNRELIQVNNTSGIPGVTWNKSTWRWSVRIKVNGIRHYLGSYKDKEKAREIRNNFVKEQHGEFAKLY